MQSLPFSLFSLLAVATPCLAGTQILWLGNSLTKVDEIPQAVHDLAVATGYEGPTYREQILWGRPLQDHIDRFNADGTDGVLYTGLPEGEQWDYVVLQEYGQDTGSGSPQDTIDDALTLADMILEHSPDATLILYERWASGLRSYVSQTQTQEVLHTANTSALAAINDTYGEGTAVLSDVGAAFAELSFDTLLYAGITGNGDWLHQSSAGALLSAMVHYGVLYGDPTLQDLPFSTFLETPWMQDNVRGTSIPRTDMIDEALWTRLASAAEIILNELNVTRATDYPSDFAGGWASQVNWAEASASPTADPDGDTLSNLTEYLRGTDPLTADPVNDSWAQITSETAELQARFGPVRNDPGLNIVLEASEDLENWEVAETSAISHAAAEGTPGFDNWALTLSPETTAQQRVFARLRTEPVSLPAPNTSFTAPPCPPASGLEYEDQLVGFDTIASVPSSMHRSGEQWTLTAGTCCGTPYASSTTDALTLSGGNYAWGSAFTNTTLPIDGPWRVTFTVEGSGVGTAAMLAFVIQNDPRGEDAIGLNSNGYVGNGAVIEPAYSMGLYANATGYIGFREGGKTGDLKAQMYHNTGVDFTAGATVTLEYDGTTLSVCITDGVNTYGTTQTVNLQSVLGTSAAHIGFISGSEGGGSYTVSDFAFATPAQP